MGGGGVEHSANYGVVLNHLLLWYEDLSMIFSQNLNFQEKLLVLKILNDLENCKNGTKLVNKNIKKLVNLKTLF